MRFAIAALVLLSAVEARAGGCDVQAARIASEIGVPVVGRVDSAFALRHPAVVDLQLHCDGPTLWKVSGGKAGAGPTGPAVHVIARAASLALHTSEEAASAALLGCVRVATGAPGQLSEATRAGLTAECTVLGERVTWSLRQAVE